MLLLYRRSLDLLRALFQSLAGLLPDYPINVSVLALNALYNLNDVGVIHRAIIISPFLTRCRRSNHNLHQCRNRR